MGFLIDRSSEILADKKDFFREKSGFLEEKLDFPLKFQPNLYKLNLGFSWVVFLAHLPGFLFV